MSKNLYPMFGRVLAGMPLILFVWCSKSHDRRLYDTLYDIRKNVKTEKSVNASAQGNHEIDENYLYGDDIEFASYLALAYPDYYLDILRNEYMCNTHKLYSAAQYASTTPCSVQSTVTCDDEYAQLLSQLPLSTDCISDESTAHDMLAGDHGRMDQITQITNPIESALPANNISNVVSDSDESGNGAVENPSLPDDVAYEMRPKLELDRSGGQ